MVMAAAKYLGHWGQISSFFFHACSETFSSGWIGTRVSIMWVSNSDIAKMGAIQKRSFPMENFTKMPTVLFSLKILVGKLSEILGLGPPNPNPNSKATDLHFRKPHIIEILRTQFGQNWKNNVICLSPKKKKKKKKMKIYIWSWF